MNTDYTDVTVDEWLALLRTLEAAIEALDAYEAERAVHPDDRAEAPQLPDWAES